ncbi:exported hypothetical protein [Vibrio crassostreae]|nr:hypothetical protein EDB46_11936 [Vibrio crassostreae]CAK2429374.1 exported hypothetical protein [Vibrio crassostreae]CAK2947962.1 exported hypothetical protein [Vibrio crassostreae]
MIRYLFILICLLCSQTAIASSNLDAFNIVIDNKTYSGYREPDRSVGQNTPAYVIYMMPHIQITRAVARDRFGIKLNLEQLRSTTGLVGASVDFELVSVLPTDTVKQRLLLELHPEDHRPTFTSPMKLSNPTPEQLEAHKQTLADLKARHQGDMIGASINRMSQYKFVSVTPRDLKLELFIHNELIASKEYGDSVVGAGSTFSLSIPRTEDYYQPSLILQRDFSVRATFKMKLTNFQMAKAYFFNKDFSSYFVRAFKEEVTRSSSSSSGFLLWKTRRSSLTRYANDMVHSGQHGGSVTIAESVLVDVDDDNMIKRVDSFLFPELNQQEVILNHMQAAKEAKSSGNTELSKLHSTYANLLKDQIANSQVPSVETDAMKALAALSQKNIAAFLANGFAMNSSQSSGKLTYRKLNNLEASHEDLRKLNQLVIDTIWVSHVIEEKLAGEAPREEATSPAINGFDFSNQPHQKINTSNVMFQCWLNPFLLNVDLLANHDVQYSSNGALAGKWYRANQNSPCLYNLQVNGFSYCIDYNLLIDRWYGHGRCQPCSSGNCT